MTKVVLDDLTNLQNEASAVNTINVNNNTIEQAFENTISRDGSAPNTMEGELDMNYNRILNLPDPIHPYEPLRKIDRDNFIVDLDQRVFDAAQSATDAAASASAAASSAGNAAVSEVNADASEAAALSYKNAAAASATAAASSADDAAASAALAQAALDVTAAGIPSDATGDVSATTVQGAIAELASEKATKAELSSAQSTLNTSIGTKLNSSLVSTYMLTVLDDTSASAARATLGVDYPHNYESAGDGLYDLTASVSTVSTSDFGKVFLVNCPSCYQIALPAMSAGANKGAWFEFIMWGQPSSSYSRITASNPVLYGSVSNLTDFYSHGYGERLKFTWTGYYWTVDVLSNSGGNLLYKKKYYSNETNAVLTPDNFYYSPAAADVSNSLPSLVGSSLMAFIPRVAGRYQFTMEARMTGKSATKGFYGGVALGTAEGSPDIVEEFAYMQLGEDDRKFALTYTMQLPQMTSGIYGQIFATSNNGRMYPHFLYFTARWLGR